MENSPPPGTAVAAAPPPPVPARKLDLNMVVAAPPGSSGGVTFLPRTLAECLDFATVMSKSDFAIPVKFRNNPGACLAVTIQSCRWEADPFGVIQKAYVVKAADGSERIAYEGQLVAAIVNTRARLAGRLELVYSGDGATRKLKVIGTFATGERREIDTPTVAKAKKKSPLWDSDPDQQLAYYGMRSWGRRWVPEVLLGIYTPEDFQDEALADAQRPARIVNPDRASAEEILGEGVQRAAEPETPIQAEDTVEGILAQAASLAISPEEARKIDEMKVEPDAAAVAAGAHGISGEGLEPVGDPRGDAPPLDDDEASAEFATWEKYLVSSVELLNSGDMKTEAEFDEFAALVKTAFKNAKITEDEQDDLRARFVSKLLERKRQLFGRARR